MKKSILQFSVIAAIAASMTLTTSCSSDDSVAEAYVPEAVKFGIDLGDMTVARANTRTQAANTATVWTTSIDGKFAVNDIVYIWTTDADGNYYRKAYKVKTAAENSGEANLLQPNGSAASDQFYWKNTTEYKRYEIYSFGKSGVDSTNIKDANRLHPDDLTYEPSGVPTRYTYTVPADQSNEANKTEFLFGYGTLYYAASSTTKALKVTHQLARIDVKLKTKKNRYEVTKNLAGDDLTSLEPAVENKPATTSENFELKIGWGDMPLKGLFSAPNYTPISTGTTDEIKGNNNESEIGSWTTDDAVKGQITPRVLVEQRYDTTNDNFVTQYSAVVMPQTVAANVDWFTINYDGATYKYKIPTGGFTIKPGKKYVYTVTFEDTNINVSVAIQEWNDGFTGDEGNVEAVLQAGS